TLSGNVEVALELERRRIDAGLGRNLPGRGAPGQHDGEDDHHREGRGRERQAAGRSGERPRGTGGRTARGQGCARGLREQCRGLLQLKEKFAHGFFERVRLVLSAALKPGAQKRTRTSTVLPAST